MAQGICISYHVSVVPVLRVIVMTCPFENEMSQGYSMSRISEGPDLGDRLQTSTALKSNNAIALPISSPGVKGVVSSGFGAVVGRVNIGEDSSKTRFILPQRNWRGTSRIYR